MLNVLAVTRFIINPAARFVARAASRMIFTGPLGSIGNIFMAQGYSFLLHSPTNLGRTKKINLEMGAWKIGGAHSVKSLFQLALCNIWVGHISLDKHFTANYFPSKKHGLDLVFGRDFRACL